VLVYPEVGLDPMAYFLAFARLAPVQCAWWGHPDTTGIPAIDYFVSSTAELPDADKHYSERLVRMQGLGASFMRQHAGGDMRRRELRQRLQDQMGLPSSVHLYLCPQALFKFHPSFDDVLIEILAKDKLA
jgi:protein O-GlcNAc transferase